MGRTMELEHDDGCEPGTTADPPAEVAASAAAGMSGQDTRSDLQREIAALSDRIIRIITSGNWESLLPNSRSSVDVGGHQVCVSYDEESSADYRTWEWQGHILLFDYEEQMYVPEYVYGNYFEPLLKSDCQYEDFLGRPPYGLTGMINRIESGLNRME